ncbi:endospore germination permease [Paenibacillus sp. GCM10023248]|uniref:GerAB/ArcD/ProY family transporter n=1 Tax=unclassified Paenibacillus TaxID=185978 RepID=UPI0023784200|nr:endospore germination permease [Paenibacillus sp. MAHUQ-63]MDD9268483.1 endospore germination permease [Paenibacillus sp. MAHUQ-63]
MQPEKISGSQLGLLQFTFIMSTIILTIPRIMVNFAMQDAWLSVLPSTITGLICIWVMITLAKRYPGLTIIEYSSLILGKWLGKGLGLYYLYFWYMSISAITKQHTFFISTLLLPNSPPIVANFTIILLAALAVIAGIEVIARSNEFLTMLMLVFLFPLLLLSIKEADPGQLQPILGDGIVPILRAAITPAASFMNQLFILGWLLPYLNQPKKAAKASLFALLGVFLLVFGIVILTIMVLGPLTSRLNYSFLSVIQYAAIEGSFERLEAVAVAMWVMGTFVKIALSLFILSQSLSHLFGIQSYREFVYPLALLSVIGSVWIFKDVTGLYEYLSLSYPIGGLVSQSLIPLLLLLIDTIKRSVKSSSL